MKTAVEQAAEAFANTVGSRMSVEAWAEKRLRFDQEAETSIKEMYNDYACWCASRGVGAFGKRTLANYLTKAGVVRVHTKLGTAYRGLAIVA